MYVIVIAGERDRQRAGEPGHGLRTAGRNQDGTAGQLRQHPAQLLGYPSNSITISFNTNHFNSINLHKIIKSSKFIKIYQIKNNQKIIIKNNQIKNNQKIMIIINKIKNN